MLSKGLRSSRFGRLFLAPLTLGAALLAAPAQADGGGTSELNTSFAGDFTLAYGHLSFSGTSLPPRYGLDSVDGDTDLAPVSPVCFVIVNDAVTITTYDGSELYIENSGEDCLDFSTGAPVIMGSGTTLVLGGTGRFADASGQGTYNVAAYPETIGDGTAAGTFSLDFDLFVTHP